MGAGDGGLGLVDVVLGRLAAEELAKVRGIMGYGSTPCLEVLRLPVDELAAQARRVLFVAASREDAARSRIQIDDLKRKVGQRWRIPPVAVEWMGSYHYLVDGNHRVVGFEELGRGFIQCIRVVRDVRREVEGLMGEA